MNVHDQVAGLLPTNALVDNDRRVCGVGDPWKCGNRSDSQGTALREVDRIGNGRSAGMLRWGGEPFPISPVKGRLLFCDCWMRSRSGARAEENGLEMDSRNRKEAIAPGGAF
jgi:hypothetical protein